MYILAGYNQTTNFLEVFLTIPAEKIDLVRKIVSDENDEIFLSTHQALDIARAINEKISPKYDYFLETCNLVENRSAS